MFARRGLAHIDALRAGSLAPSRRGRSVHPRDCGGGCRASLIRLFGLSSFIGEAPGDARGRGARASSARTRGARPCRRAARAVCVVVRSFADAPSRERRRGSGRHGRDAAPTRGRIAGEFLGGEHGDHGFGRSDDSTTANGFRANDRAEYTPVLVGAPGTRSLDRARPFGVRHHGGQRAATVDQEARRDPEVNAPSPPAAGPRVDRPLPLGTVPTKRAVPLGAMISAARSLSACGEGALFQSSPGNGASWVIHLRHMP